MKDDDLLPDPVKPVPGEHVRTGEPSIDDRRGRDVVRDARGVVPRQPRDRLEAPRFEEVARAVELRFEHQRDRDPRIVAVRESLMRVEDSPRPLEVERCLGTADRADFGDRGRPGLRRTGDEGRDGRRETDVSESAGGDPTEGIHATRYSEDRARPDPRRFRYLARRDGRMAGHRVRIPDDEHDHRQIGRGGRPDRIDA